MKKWLVVLLSFLLFACSDSFSPNRANLNGTYELTSIDGKSVPVVVEKGLTPGLIGTGALVLDTNRGRNFYAIYLDICPPNFICIWGAVSVGVFEINGNRLLFKQFDEDNKVELEFEGYVVSADYPSGFANGDVIEVQWLQSDWIFIRR